MKFSILTATFNSEQTISDTIKSINSQNYRTIEHIIIDACSSDKTISIITSEASIRPKIISEKDHGIYDALNKGIRKASGDYILCLHSDDMLASNTILADVKEIIIENDYPDIMFFSITLQSQNGEKYWNATKDSVKGIRNGWYPPHTGMIVKAGLMKKKIYNSNMKIASDYCWIYDRIATPNIRIYISPIVLCKMRNDGRSQKIKGKLTGNLEILKHLIEINSFWPAVNIFTKRLIFSIKK